MSVESNAIELNVVPRRRSPQDSDLRTLLFGSPLILASLGWLYYPTFLWLAERWQADDYYAHGPIIPFISLYIIWRRKESIGQAWLNRRFAWPLLLPAGLAIQLIGALADVNFVRGFSLPIVLLGIAQLIGGRGVERLLRFPILFLFMAIPITPLLLETLSFPFQINAAKYASLFLGLGGIPVERSGVNLHASNFSFVVAAPCSGLKTTITLLTLALVVAHFMPNISNRTRALICALSVPIALVANTLRVMLILLIGLNLGEKAAEGFLHNFSGIFMLAISAGLLSGFGSVFAKMWPTGETDRPPAASARTSRKGLAVMPVCVVIVGLLLGTRWTGAYLLETSRPVVVNVTKIELPDSIGVWRGQKEKVDPVVMEILRPDAINQMNYSLGDPKASPSIKAIVVYSRGWRSVHSPVYCLTGSGWSIQKQQTHELRKNGQAINVNLITAEQQGHQMQLLYYFVGSEQEMTGWISALARLTIARFSKGPVGAGQVQLAYTPQLFIRNGKFIPEFVDLTFAVTEAVRRSIGLSATAKRMTDENSQRG